jgi:uncharacterized protein (TIGR00730 family)
MAKPKTTKGRVPELAFLNEKFMQSSDARALRISAEYLDPLARLKRAGVQNTVVFFGSARILPRDRALEKLRELQTRDRRSRPPAGAAQLRRARMAVDVSRYYEEARELARLITEWSLSLHNGSHFLVVCSGGGPGIMEAANRGASEAGGLSIGLNIKLPAEQQPNPYITPELSFMFKYFFMRKLWFAQPAKALIVFPGGFGTMDELWEFLTLIQTGKMGHRAVILLYGSEFWNKAVNFAWLAEAGTVTPQELQLVRFVDSPAEAFEVVKQKLSKLLRLRVQPAHPFI